MERATRGGLIVSGQTLDRVSVEDLESLGVNTKRVRRQVFGPRQSGVPADLVMYRVTANPDQSGEDEADGQ